MKTKNILIYSALVLGGLFLGYLFFGGQSEPQSMDEHIAETHTDEESNIVYTCSMHPQVRENEPGNCPICGMELIPANNMDEDADLTQNPNAVQISRAAIALAEIQTSEVRLEIPARETRLPGKIAVDERQIQFIPAHFHGRIEQLYVNFTGDYISKGQKIARVYSPLLFTAQKELLEAYKNRDQNPELYSSARQKLLNWKIPKWQLNEIIASGVPSQELDIYSHKKGFVLKRHATVGNHLSMGDIMFEISPLDTLWGLFDAYEKDVADLKLGDEINFKIEAYPAITMQSSISYIQPTLNSQSRTVSIRIEIPNTNEGIDLKPGMLINGLVSTKATGQPQLIIPRSAVMWTGKRSIVFVDVSEGENPAFEAREVELGSRAGNDYVIESGLDLGEHVVTNGTFKVDAAAQLSDKLSMMNREPGTGRGAPSMPGMDMNDSEMESMVEHSKLQMQDDLEVLIPEYLQLREALTMDDFESARERITLFSEDNFSNIEVLRAEFKSISEMLITRVEEEGYEGNLFKQYCPMYDGGSSWISDEEVIENPFYGTQMHNCGETVEQMN